MELPEKQGLKLILIICYFIFPKSLQWNFQKNKDWNSSILDFILSIFSCCSGTSRKTRIETSRIFLNIRPIHTGCSGTSRKTRIETQKPHSHIYLAILKLQWNFQKNKDWNKWLTYTYFLYIFVAVELPEKQGLKQAVTSSFVIVNNCCSGTSC